MENPSLSRAEEPVKDRVNRQPTEERFPKEGSLKLCPNCALPTVLKLLSIDAQKRERVFKRLATAYPEANNARSSA